MKKGKKLIAILTFFALNVMICMAATAHIYVSPSGSDLSDGGKRAPLKTPAQALIKVRQMHKRDTVYIHLADGVYPLDEPLRLRAEDSGTEDSPLVIVADHPGKAFLSGGKNIDMNERMVGLNWWKEQPVVGNHTVEVRQLWRGGEKVPHSSLVPLDSLMEIAGFSRERQELWIQAADFDPVLDLIYGSRLGLAEDERIMRAVKSEEIRGLEFVACTERTFSVLRVRNFWVDGDLVKFTFHNPESRVLFSRPEMPLFYNMIGGYSLVYPGTWYQDPKDGSIVYDPDEADRAAGHNDASTPFVIPVLEHLVQIQGSDADPVHHIIFRGVAFEYTAWLHPARSGAVTVPGGNYMLTGGLVDRQEAAVSIACAHHVDFADCQFLHIGATAIDYQPGCSQGSVTGCHFSDIGGSAIATPKNPGESGFRILRNTFEGLSNEIWFSDAIRQ